MKLTRKQIEDLKKDKETKTLTGQIITKQDVRDTKFRDKKRVI